LEIKKSSALKALKDLLEIEPTLRICNPAKLLDTIPIKKSESLEVTVSGENCIK